MFPVSFLLIYFSFALVRSELVIYYADAPLPDPNLIAGACNLLLSSFSGFLEDFNDCERYLTSTEYPRTRGLYMEDQEVVAFISSGFWFDESKETSLMFISEICVREDRRGRGLASKMIPAYINAILTTSLTGLPDGHRTTITLSVDLESADAVKAFSLYAKLGFLRWYPTELDSHPTEDTEGSNNFSKLWFNRDSLTSFVGEIDTRFQDLNMYKEVVDGVDEETFEAMGRAIVKAYQERCEREQKGVKWERRLMTLEDMLESAPHASNSN